MAVESRSASEPLPAFDPDLDHFARLGLPRQFSVDRDALEDHYLARSQVVHPDRHVDGDSATRRAALEHSSALNEGYRVLRDPVRRAEYLVRLGGIDLDSSDPQTGAPHPEQAFLIEMIERRERLEAVRQQGADALEDLRDDVDGERERVFAEVRGALASDDVRAAAAGLVHLRYLRRFLEEIDAALA